MRTNHQPGRPALSALRRSRLALAVACAFAGPAAMAAVAVPFDPTKLVVTNSLDDGNPGSLRYAINYANAFCATQPAPTISFNIPGTGPFTINASQPLPAFYCDPLTTTTPYTPVVDGYTQPGSSPNTSANGFNANIMVAVDGSLNVYGGCALGINNSETGFAATFQGLEVRNWLYGGGICGHVTAYGNRIANNDSGVQARNGSVVGAVGSANRNVIIRNASGITVEGAFSIGNNLIGADDYGGALVGAANNRGVYFSCCTQPLGEIKGNVIVGGYSGVELSYDGVANIEGNLFNTDGTNLLGTGTYGISLYYSYGASIRDNVIAGISNTAIRLQNGQNVLIKGNKVGTNAAGTEVLGGGYEGIYESFGYGTRIEGNLVSGTQEDAVILEGSTTAVITGNSIGTNASGNAALGNGWSGIFIGSSASDILVESNLISGNDTAIFSSFADNVTFYGNRIGLGANGVPVPNQYGLIVACSTNARIDSNTLSGNAVDGLELLGVQGSLVIDNDIGATAGNGGHGVFMVYQSCFGGGGAQSLAPKAAAAKILTGGTFEADLNRLEGNQIANNGGSGVFISGGNRNFVFQNVITGNSADGMTIAQHTDKDAYGGLIVVSAATGNSILENLVYGNLAKAVNLGFPGGPLPNDAGDGDAGPNNGQNYPVLNPNGVIYDPVSNSTTIGFGIDTKAGDYRIDFFSNPGPGAPQGTAYLGNTSINLAADGIQFGTYTVSGPVDNVSSTATRLLPLGTLPQTFELSDTSEFSLQVAATTLPVPGVNVVPGSVNFGDVVVGRSSGPATVTVQSTGTAPYQVRSLREGSCTGPAICTTGSFSCSTTCSDGSSWTSPSSCTITASFTPTATGSQTKTLALCDNTAGSPRTITLTGNGIDPPTVDIAYSPASWSFGEVLVGAQSAIKSFTLKNSGTNTVYLGPATTSGDFVINGGSCGPTLAGGASCSTDVSYVPTARGGVNGTLAITGSNTAPGSPAALRSKVTTATTNTASALLQGSGLQVGAVSLPTSISFGTFVLNSAQGQQNLELRNTGNGSLAISSLTIGGPFAMTNDCGATLAAGSACTIVMTFNPTSLGAANGTLNVVTDAPGGSRAIALTAQVNADARPVIRITPSQMGFGNRQIGTESTAQALTIRNDGAQTASLGPMIITQPENSGAGESKNEFSITGTTCATTLAPQASCVASIVFRALGFGERKGEVSVSSNSADTPQKATLSGTGCRPYAAGVNRSGRDPCAP